LLGDVRRDEALHGILRVIYFLRRHNDEIWMLTLYAKNVADNIPAKVLKKIKEEIDAED